MSTSITNQRYYPALDGIRGLAIILVVLYHYFGFVSQFFFGWLGVDMFFVLSGYLITGILIKDLKEGPDLKTFFKKRALRIFPLYYLILFIIIVAFPLLNLYKTQIEYYVAHQLWLWFFLQNWLFSFNFNAEAAFLSHFWSLAVEEQFYLVWPFIIYWIKDLRRLFIFMSCILALVIIARCFVWIYYSGVLNYTTLYTFTRIDGICIGSMVALTEKIDAKFINRNMPFIVTALAVFNFSFFFLNKFNQYSFPYYAFVGYTTFAALFGLLVFEAANNNNLIIQSFFTFNPLRFLGKISYGIYVFHWPIYVLLHPSILSLFKTLAPNSSNTIQLLSALSCIFITFCISVISFYTFERYFLNLRKRLR